MSHAGSSWLERLERALPGRRKTIILAIIAVSALLRGLYFVQLDDTPLVQAHRWNQSDMHYYDSWARRLARGDWLSRDVPVPIHLWHEAIAERHIERYGPPPDPSLSAEERRALSLERTEALWDRWCGGGRFYQDPTYAYLVGITYRLLGPEVRWVFAWQMLLGVATNLLVYWLARRCFGEIAGLLTAILAIGYAPMLFYEMTLLRETLVNFIGLGVVALALPLVRTAPRPPPGRLRPLLGWERLPALWAGLAAGAALAVKAHFVLLALGILLILLLGHRPRRAGLAHAAVFCAGVALAFSPIVGRNLLVGAPPLVTASGGSPLFLVSNAADAEAAGFGLSHGARILHETGGRFVPTALAALRTHPDIGSYLALLGRRFAALMHWYEIPNNANLYFYALHAPVLRLLPWGFSIVAPLAVVGLVLGHRRGRSVALLYALVVCHAAVVLAFPVFSRFRVPLATALLPFAAVTLAELLRWAATRRWGPAAGVAALATALGLYAARPLHAGQPLIRYVDCRIPYELVYEPAVRRAADREDWQSIADVLEESLRATPRSITGLGPSQPPRNEDEASTARLYLGVHAALDQAYRRLGDPVRAARHRGRASDLEAALESRHSLSEPGR